MEITQFTYFQQCGGFECRPVSAELTYGLERICMYLQNVENVFDIEWVKGVKYREVFHRQRGGDEHATPSSESDPQMLFTLFDIYEKECKRLLERELPLPAYDYALKCSHTFNLLDARGAISRHRARRVHQAGARQRPRSAPRATSRCARGSATRC